MATTLEAESTLTDRYQTTVPKTVRRALRLGKRDKIHYTIRPSGEVVLTRMPTGCFAGCWTGGIHLMIGIVSWIIGIVSLSGQVR